MIDDFELPAGATVVHTRPALLHSPTHASFTDEHGNRFHWTSRQHRKGRYPELVASRHRLTGIHAPRLAPIWFGYPFRDLSYWVALVFTAGCIAWVVNGHYALQPYRAAAAAGSRTEEQALFVAAVAALCGGTLFEIGSWLMFWEALNQHPAVVTGKQVVHQHSHHSHHHKQQQELKGHTPQSSSSTGDSGSSSHDGGGGSTHKPCRDLEAAQQPLLVLAPVANTHPRLLQQQAAGVVRRRWLGYGPTQLLQWLIGLGRSRGDTHDACEQGEPAAAGASGSAVGSQGQQPGLRSAPRPNAAAPAGQDWTVLLSGEPPQQHAAPEAACGLSQQLEQQQQPVKPHAAQQGQQQRWVWFGFKPRDLGFIAAFLQLIGATIFWVPCIFVAPGVYAAEDASTDRVWDGVYWGLQVAGASFFIVSSAILMYEEQPAWWRITPWRIGWQVGLWNLIGGVGFLLSGAFGVLAVPQDRYQLGGTVLSTFWGSYAFLIGSYQQLVEAVNKHPESLMLRHSHRLGSH